jgi:hypothetical protein
MIMFSPPRLLQPERILQTLFPAALAWLLFVLMAEDIDRLVRMNPFPESPSVHRLFENVLPMLVAVLILLAAIGLQHLTLRFWPGFLRLSNTVRLFTVFVRLAVHAVALSLPLIVITVGISYLFYDPARDPQGQFHIWVWGGGIFYAIALTPAMAILTAWLFLPRRRSGP